MTDLLQGPLWAHVATILTFVGGFGLLDKLIDRDRRAKVAEFVFGFHSATFTSFERGVIDAIVYVFIRDEKIWLTRVFIFSCVSSLLSIWVLAALDSIASEETNFFESFAHVPVSMFDTFQTAVLDGQWRIFLIFFFPFVVFPFDLFSLFVTKRLFWKRKRHPILLAPFVFLDLILSLIPFLAFLFLIGQLDVPNNLDDLSFGMALFVMMLVGVALQTPSTVLLSIIQIMVLVLGVLLRLVSLTTRMNQRVALVGRLHENPFGFIGLLVGLLVILVL